MKLLALVSLLLPLAFADPIPRATIDKLGSQLHSGDNFTSLIIGGTPATLGQIPYIVSLRYTSGSHFCGASAVTARSIVTAAHCVEGDTAPQLAIRYNTLTHGSGGTIVQGQSLFVHEAYDSWDLINDVAVLNLAAALDLTGANAKTIGLPAQGSDPAEGTIVTVSGWGTTSEGSGSLPTDLLTVEVPIVGRAKCSAQYDTVGWPVTVEMICAGVDEGGKDACQGDSGGPLVANNQLIGATSWGYGCARPNYAGVYTRIGYFVDWINARIIS